MHLDGEVDMARRIDNIDLVRTLQLTVIVKSKEHWEARSQARRGDFRIAVVDHEIFSMQIDKSL